MQTRAPQGLGGGGGWGSKRLPRGSEGGVEAAAMEKKIRRVVSWCGWAHTRTHARAHARTHARTHPPPPHTHIPFRILLVRSCRLCVFCHCFATARAFAIAADTMESGPAACIPKQSTFLSAPKPLSQAEAWHFILNLERDSVSASFPLAAKQVCRRAPCLPWGSSMPLHAEQGMDPARLSLEDLPFHPPESTSAA